MTPREEAEMELKATIQRQIRDCQDEQARADAAIQLTILGVLAVLGFMAWLFLP